MEITRQGQVETLVGNPPEVGQDLPHFKLFNAEDQKVKTRELIGQPLLISVVPDINTRVCSSEESFGYEMKLLSPNAGVLARSIFLVNAQGQIVYRQIVEEQTDEPNYLAAINALKKLI